MSATEKLIELYRKEPLLKGVTLTSKNIKDAIFYVDEVSNCKKCKGLEFCKNKICGIKPVFDGENILYEACKYKVIEDNNTFIKSKIPYYGNVIPKIDQKYIKKI